MRNLANHVACMRADHAAAQDLAVAGGGPREQAPPYLDALGLGLVFGEADPSHFGAWGLL